MKCPVTFLFLFIFFSGNLAAQSSIKGTVTGGNGQPVAGASVFISNTSRGTVSTTSGAFFLNDIPPGTHELVVSSIGYETFVQSFTGDQLPLQLTITMKLKVKELEAVTLSPFEKDGWEKWGKVFLDNFIGTAENASNCKIINYKSIRFRYFKKEDKLTALCFEPLIVLNKALGYKIQYQLEEFEVDYRNNTMIYLGYPLFEELNGAKKRWYKARERSYHGSVMNFIRSLYSNQLQEQGFEIRRLKKIPNFEKQRIKEFFKPVRKTVLNKKTGMVAEIMDFDYERYSSDSVNYYEKVLRQKDFFDVFGDALLTADSMIIVGDKNIKYLSFPDYLYITYKKGKEETRYLQYIRESNRKPFYPRSSIILSNAVVVEENGNYYNPQDFFSLGYWGWSEKIADMLPFDYETGR